MSATILNTLVDELAADSELESQIVHRAYLPAHESSFRDLQPPLPEPIKRALAAQGVERLWSHQVAGLEAARLRQDVLVTTPTASGKSVVFQLPVLEEALAGGKGRALFLFPLKALGQDQKGKLNQLAAACGLDVARDGAAIYDGDTPRKEREKIRAEPPRVLITNPDMAHFGMLGYSSNWAQLFGSLEWIVLDELHTYRGIFGCHFYHVLQRLLRLCERHGSRPALIASSATAANASEFAQRLTGREFLALEESGAPREGRHFLLLQPSTSPYTTALQLLMRSLRAGLKTIVFTKARRITELLHSWLTSKDPQLASRVANYRAGFLPTERRQIERDLFSGKLDGVISTSALEMGIDVGGLDACILVGYPGSMMATWQRSGRVGREGRESLTALVALPDALDQYLLRNPDEFLGRACEPLIVSPGNETIGSRHLVCAAAEMPLDKKRDHSYLERHAPLVGDLLRRFELAESEHGGNLHALEKAPHRKLSLRGSGSNYSIVSEVTGRPIGTVDGVRVLRECHPGAIYLHAGKQFTIVELDAEKKRALASPSRVDYFTTPLTEKDTRILEVLNHRQNGPLQAWLGRVRVTEQVVGFERKRIMSQERLGQEGLELPSVQFETVAMWWSAPPAIEETLRENAEDFMGALHASEHAAISLFPVLALCDRGDLGGISIPFHDQVGCGAVFLYDGHPGGVGIAESGFLRLPELLDKVAGLLEGCDCESGCPACVQSPKCGNGNRPLDKAGALRFVRLLLDREQPIRPVEEVEAPSLEAGEETEDAVDGVRDAGRSPADFRLTAHGRYRLDGPTGGEAGGAGRDLFDLGDPESRSGSRSRSATGHQPSGDLRSSPPRQRQGDEVQARVPSQPPDGSGQRPDGGAHSLRDHRAPSSPGRNLDSAAKRKRKRKSGSGRRARLPEAPYRAPLPRTVTKTVVFDVETKRSAEEVGGWHQLHKLGVALAVALDLEDGRFHVYREEQVNQLVHQLHSADLVIGFNVQRFDYPVLSGYAGEDFRRTLPTLDLFEQIERIVGDKIGLSRLASATFGSEKSGDGLQSLEWYKQGRFDLIEDYCRKDVELLRDLYLFGRREGYVCHRDDQDRVVRIPVDWI